MRRQLVEIGTTKPQESEKEKKKNKEKNERKKEVAEKQNDKKRAAHQQTLECEDGDERMEKKTGGLLLSILIPNKPKCNCMARGRMRTRTRSHLCCICEAC